MNLFNRALVVGTALAVSSGMAQANHLDDRWYMAPMAGLVLSDLGEGDVDAGGSVYFAVGKALSEHWNIEFSTAYSELSTDGSDGGSDYERFGILGINGQYHLDRDQGLDPYLLIGMTAVKADFADADDYAPSAEIGAGFNLPLSEQVSFRTELRYELNFHGGNAAIGDDTYYQWQLRAGLQIAIGEKSTHTAPVAAIKPLPVVVDEVEKVVVVKEVEVERVAITRPVSLPSILFPLDSSTLTADSKTTLNDVSRTMTDNPDMNIDIIGHADDTGPSDYNLKLSQRRCKSVRDYLIARGIDENRLEIAPQGEARPISTNDTASGRQKNRRVDLEIQ